MNNDKQRRNKLWKNAVNVTNVVHLASITTMDTVIMEWTTETMVDITEIIMDMVSITLGIYGHFSFFKIY